MYTQMLDTLLVIRKREKVTETRFSWSSVDNMSRQSYRLMCYVHIYICAHSQCLFSLLYQLWDCFYYQKKKEKVLILISLSMCYFRATLRIWMNFEVVLIFFVVSALFFYLRTNAYCSRYYCKVRLVLCFSFLFLFITKKLLLFWQSFVLTICKAKISRISDSNFE